MHFSNVDSNYYSLRRYLQEEDGLLLTIAKS